MGQSSVTPVPRRDSKRMHAPVASSPIQVVPPQEENLWWQRLDAPWVQEAKAKIAGVVWKDELSHYPQFGSHLSYEIGDDAKLLWEGARRGLSQKATAELERLGPIDYGDGSTIGFALLVEGVCPLDGEPTFLLTVRNPRARVLPWIELAGRRRPLAKLGYEGAVNAASPRVPPTVIDFTARPNPRKP